MLFERSVQALLALIQLRLQADSVTLREHNTAREQPAGAVRLPIPRTRFELDIGLPSGSSSNASALHSVAALIEALSAVLARVEEAAKLHQLLMDAVNLEFQLADCKIADRSEGMLATGLAEPDKMLVHVQRVLSPVASLAAAARRAADLKNELAERQQLAAAKKLLQATRGLTESEAYLHLQRASRRSRQSLQQVARDVLQCDDTDRRRIA